MATHYRPTPWQKFRRDPSTQLAFWLQSRRRHTSTSGDAAAAAAGSCSSSPISVVCVSDTHCAQPEVPDGDVLLHAGDLTNRGSFEELQEQLDWLNTMPHRYKVVIGGNHDKLLDAEYVRQFPDRICEDEGTSRSDLDWGDIVYLHNSSTTLRFANGRRLKVYGSPLTECCGTWAFQYPPIRQVWAGTVPDDTDILLTHGPPRGHLDNGGKGCPQLLKEVCRVRPRLVVFGHIHVGAGQEEMTYSGADRAYHCVMTGEGGLLAVALMAFWVLVECIWPRRGTEHTTTLVNAAVVGGQKNELAVKVVDM
ncbi:hypothetical protein CEP52_015126 [Fusarium oligoseptatum]|uniref:Calcineurin-like phosphoesterase domain-containing protein n=2 Tax=Fusarium solani species complex TaxID=232080 RepID=A0A428SG28_9HYPO|nr:hypothetical protein CEP52_015126 [Fusarium oligoseptatum]RSM20771.1 hypothetical protein CDV31_000461 [Fusarium ambrosium]